MKRRREGFIARRKPTVQTLKSRQIDVVGRITVRLPLIASLLLAMGSAAKADNPSEVVKPFYLKPGLELEQSARGNFIDPARKVLDQNDAIRLDGEEGCLDPALPFNDTNYDPDEVARTLRLEEIVSGGDATVLARFMAEEEEHSVQWMLKEIGGSWRISDVASMSKDWALSRFQCE